MSLAALEAFVHLGRTGALLKFMTIGVEIPDDVVVTTLDRKVLPATWRSEPPADETKQVGTDWATKRQTAVLKVPSVTVPEESNFLLNPAHTY